MNDVLPSAVIFCTSTQHIPEEETMDLIEGINASEKKLNENTQGMRILVGERAKILIGLTKAKESIEKILESAKTKPATIPILSVAGLSDLLCKNLKDAGIEFLEDFEKIPELEAQKIPGLGPLAFDIIRSAMLTHDLNFAT